MHNSLNVTIYGEINASHFERYHFYIGRLVSSVEESSDNGKFDVFGR